MPPHDHNRRAWDDMVRQGQRFTVPAKDEDFANPLQTVDPMGWLGGDIRGKRLLCLAAGGGKHSALYAAAGAIVTVVDISPAMLELDRQVAAQRRYQVRVIEASMDSLGMFTPGEFDVVIQPVSSCYLPEIAPIYREVSRITRPGGLYISQHKSPTSLQADIRSTPLGYPLIEPYFRSGPLPTVVGSPHREEGTLEYLHRWEELLGYLCRSGFVIEDFIEPRHDKAEAALDTFGHRSCFISPYLRIKARRTGSAHQPTTNSPSASQSSGLWLP